MTGFKVINYRILHRVALDVLNPVKQCRYGQTSCWLRQSQNLSSSSCTISRASKNIASLIEVASNGYKVPYIYRKCQNISNHNYRNFVTKSSPNVELEKLVECYGKPTRISPRVYFQESKLQRQPQAEDEEKLKKICELKRRERKLVVLMTWLGAEERHINKYRQFYLERGFDVLNVNTTSIDILVPRYFTKRNAADCVRFLTNSNYDRIFYHGFSVGGFMFGQVILEMMNQKQDVRDRLCDSIRGIVLDSVVVLADFQAGVANSFTENKFIAKFLEYLIGFYKRVAGNIATVYFQEVQDFVFSGPLNRPSLHVYSKGDPIIDHRNAQRLADCWIHAGIELERLVVEDAGHVQIFRKYHDDYVIRLEKLLKRVQML